MSVIGYLTESVRSKVNVLQLHPSKEFKFSFWFVRIYATNYTLTHIQIISTRDVQEKCLSQEQAMIITMMFTLADLLIIEWTIGRGLSSSCSFLLCFHL